MFKTTFDVVLQVEKRDIKMQVDTGASISLISEQTHKKEFSQIKLNRFDKVLTTYTGEPINVRGWAEVNITYKDQRARLPIFVVAGEGPSLLGRNWLGAIRLDWRDICNVQIMSIDDLLSKYSSIFECDLSKYNGPL